MRSDLQTTRPRVIIYVYAEQLSGSDDNCSDVATKSTGSPRGDVLCSVRESVLEKPSVKSCSISTFSWLDLNACETYIVIRSFCGNAYSLSYYDFSQPTGSVSGKINKIVPARVSISIEYRCTDIHFCVLKFNVHSLLLNILFKLGKNAHKIVVEMKFYLCSKKKYHLSRRTRATGKVSREQLTYKY